MFIKYLNNEYRPMIILSIIGIVPFLIMVIGYLFDLEFIQNIQYWWNNEFFEFMFSFLGLTGKVIHIILTWILFLMIFLYGPLGLITILWALMLYFFNKNKD